MGNAYIVENEGSDGQYSSFDIRVDCRGDSKNDPTIVRCWDFLLAEELLKAVNRYLGNEYKVSPHVRRRERGEVLVSRL